MIKTSDDLKKAESILKQFQEGINKKYGAGSIAKMGEMVKDVKVIPTGVLTLDHMLGVGGIPRGRIIEVYGPEASGKTTFALNLIKNVQMTGGHVCFIDMEQALDPLRAAELGVDLQKVFFAQPNSGEEALDIMNEAIKTGVFDLVILDSVAALVTKAELAGDIGDTHMALVARLLSQTLKTLSVNINNTDTAALFINQLRANISTTGYGGPTETTSGGKALRFYSSVRLDMRRTEWIKKGEEVIGQKVKVKSAKNKVAAPFKTANVELYFKEGFTNNGLLIDMAVEAGVFTRSGAYYYEDGEKLSQGKEKLRQILNDDPLKSMQTEFKIRTALNMGGIEELTKRIEEYTPNNAPVIVDIDESSPDIKIESTGENASGDTFVAETDDSQESKSEELAEFIDQLAESVDDEENNRDDEE